MDSFARIQKDHVSLAAQELLPLLRLTVPHSDRAKGALALLSKWDGAMDADRPEPLIFSTWVREVSRQIFADELGEALMKDYWEQRNVHQSMLNVLKNTDGQGVWCKNTDASSVAKPQHCADALSASLDTALGDLTRRYGDDISAWRWGEAHVARSEHRPFGKIAPLAGLFDIRVPTPGDTFTVNVGRYNLRDEVEPFASRHAAGLRALYDLSNLENSRFIHSTGQSGNVLSALYRDYSRRWSEVAYLPMKTNRAAAEKNKLGTLTLNP